AFITKLSARGNSLIYSTYVGGSRDDLAYDIAIDAAGNAYIAGGTMSTNFPTANPLQSTNQGGSDAFVAKMNPRGNGLVYATYLGGDGSDRAQGIAVDASGSVYVTGYTASSDFPTENPFMDTNSGTIDVFVSKFRPQGTALVYSTYLGGYDADGGNSIAVD